MALVYGKLEHLLHNEHDEGTGSRRGLGGILNQGAKWNIEEHEVEDRYVFTAEKTD